MIDISLSCDGAGCYEVGPPACHLAPQERKRPSNVTPEKAGVRLVALPKKCTSKNLFTVIRKGIEGSL